MNGDVKWIKVVTNIFDDEKFKLFDEMKDNDLIIAIWFKMLCLAGKINNHGMLILNENIPYSCEMFSKIFKRKRDKVQKVLDLFEKFGMIETVNGVITITNWDKYQNSIKLDSMQEYNRLAKQKEREKKKTLLKNVDDNVKENVNDKSMTSQGSQCTDIDIDIEEETDIRNKEKKNIEKKENDSIFSLSDIEILAEDNAPTFYKRYVNKPSSFNGSKNLGDMVTAVQQQYSLDDLKKLFIHAEKTYWAEIKYLNCDLVWIINNAKKVLATAENETAKQEEPEERIPGVMYL